ncbi:MAG: DoxX family protein [Phenylobacterium sp.]|uniref:DoxX family protein n=1 Tax=Phenylobacterium sp. TaxID=1871053 RepID=UPI00122A6594|nr:DoxX family protein [Phenylobacterium sp.]TAJ68440.1 MAG: DoxX family protein [Phenylobacterium sp.]
MTDIAATAAPPNGKATTIAGWTLTGLFAAFMVFDVGIKLVGHPEVAKSAAQLGLPPGSGFGIGLMEGAILALYLFPRTAMLGAVLVAALMGGTCAVHLLNENPLFSHMLFGPYLALFAWGGLWLRDAKLRALFPIRR